MPIQDPCHSHPIEIHFKFFLRKKERDGTGLNFPTFKREGLGLDFSVRPCMYGIIREYEDEAGARESQPDARSAEGCDSPGPMRAGAL